MSDNSAKGGGHASPAAAASPRAPGVKVIALFLAHAFVSVFLTLMNKTISTGFPYMWSIVLIQNCGTLVCSGVLHVLGYNQLRLPGRDQVLYLAIDSVWLIAVLWSSLTALERVSVPLYVVVRNTVPFLTAICERVALKRQLDMALLASLAITFFGTMLYSVNDMSARNFSGTAHAVSNALLVATMCVYENFLRSRFRDSMTSVDLNFHRVLLSMPGLLVVVALTEGFPQPILELAGRRTELILVILSSLFAFSIGTLLFGLQAEVSATTIQVANVSYKCVTTLVSRLTHPSEVLPLGYVGYAICTGGVFLYTYSRAPATKPKPA